MSGQPWRSRGHIVPGGSRNQSSSTPVSTPVAGQPELSQSSTTPGRNDTWRGNRGRGRGNSRAWGRGRGPGRDVTSVSSSLTAVPTSSSSASTPWRRNDSTSTPSVQQKQQYQAPSRLKPARIDPLQELGLPSKGDDRLLEYATQEAYFAQITARYENLYGQLPTPGGIVARPHDETTSSRGNEDSANRPGAGDSLATAMSGLDIDTTPLSGYGSSTTATAAGGRGFSGGSASASPPSLPSTATLVPVTSAATGGASGILVTAMRGLREGLLASGRADGFAVAAYTFVVRAGIAAAGYETYVPALGQLLGRVYETQRRQQQHQHQHQQQNQGRRGTQSGERNDQIEKGEREEEGNEQDVVMKLELLRELVAYHILDLACRRAAYGEALAARAAWRRKEPGLGGKREEKDSFAVEVVDTVLQALIRGDWTGFWEARRWADGFQAKLIATAEERMREHAIECLTKTYFTVSREYVKGCTGESIDTLKEGGQVQWEVEGNAVVIRRITKSR